MNTAKLKSQGLIAALFATATWGMAGIFVRWLPGWSPFAILAGRFLVAIVAMLPMFVLFPKIRQDIICSLVNPLIWWLCLPAIGGYVLGTSAFQMAPVGEVTLLFTTSPVFIIAYKYVARLHIKLSEGWGVLLAMMGIILVMLPQLTAFRSISGQAMTGYLLALGAAGLVALYTYWFNWLTRRSLAPQPTSIVFVTCLLGSMISLLGLIIFSPGLSEIRIDRQASLILSMLGIFSTAFPFFCYTVAAQCLPVILTTAILLLEPVFAALFASLALQEIPTLWFGLGSGLIFWGLLLIASKANL